MTNRLKKYNKTKDILHYTSSDDLIKLVLHLCTFKTPILNVQIIYNFLMFSFY